MLIRKKIKTLSQPAAFKGKSEVSYKHASCVPVEKPDRAPKQIKYTLCCVGIKVWLGRKYSATGKKTLIFVIHTMYVYVCVWGGGILC